MGIAMSVKSQIFTELELFLLKVSGKISDQTAYEYQDAIPNMPGYKPTLNTLIDAREVTENLLSPSSIIRLSANTPFDATVKRAFVVNSDNESMLATLYGTTTSDQDKYLVTNKIDTACRWLGFNYTDISQSDVYLDD